MTVIFKSGTCRVCGCTDLTPCLMDRGRGNPLEACHWLDPDHTLCSNLNCIAETPLAQLEQIIEARA